MQALTRNIRLFNGLKRQSELLAARQKSIRDELMDLLNEYGEEDDKGNKVLVLPEQCEDVVALVKQRKTARGFDQDAAEEILKSKGLYDECTETVVVLDEDKILAARYEERLTDEDIDVMFPTSVSWAFTPKRVK